VLKLANLLRTELSKLYGVTLLWARREREENKYCFLYYTKSRSTNCCRKAWEQKIVLVVCEIWNKKIIRASPHFFNTEEEILKVVEAIKNL